MRGDEFSLLGFGAGGRLRVGSVGSELGFGDDCLGNGFGDLGWDRGSSLTGGFHGFVRGGTASGAIRHLDYSRYRNGPLRDACVVGASPRGCIKPPSRAPVYTQVGLCNSSEPSVRRYLRPTLESSPSLKTLLRVAPARTELLCHS